MSTIKKFQLNHVLPVFDRPLPLEAVGKQLQPLAMPDGLYFADPVTGAGYLQWTLPGDDWQSFADADERSKSDIAQLYQERKEKVQSR
ncbi:MAG: hypothetical protein LIQ26_01250, partial [Bacteroidota bacterium]|nr:hypothetical protein [Bacteroidota bacterium]